MWYRVDMVAAPDLLVPPRTTSDAPKAAERGAMFNERTFFGVPSVARVINQERMTIEQWANMAEDEPGEFVDGYLVEEEVPDFLHESVVAWLVFTLRSWGKPRKAFVFPSELKYAVSERRGRKPDVSMYAPSVHTKNVNLTREPPLLMVEVLTPTARDVRRDRVEKMTEYAQFGVRSYWIVDPKNRYIECYELSKDGRVFLSATAAQGQLEVPNFDDLVLDLDELWSEVDRVEDAFGDDEPTEM